MTPQCYLIVGFGSIGKRHLNNLRALQPDAKIVVMRRASQVSTQTEVPEGADYLVSTLEQALSFAPGAAIIANPAPFHVKIAQQLVEHDIHLLVEKPIAASLDGVEQLIATAQERSLILMTAYNFRFSEAAIRFRDCLLSGEIGKLLSVCVDTGQYLPNWRPDSDYRQGVSARKDLGGGVLLELSHELDYLRWIFGDVETVYARCAKSGELEIDPEVEESIDMLLGFKSGLSANVHIDFIQALPHRICKVIGARGTLVWDAVHHEVRINTLDEPQGRLLVAPNEQRNDMYLDEITHFIECIVSSKGPKVDGVDGLAALKIVLAAKRSAQTKQVITIG
ncbi:MAG: Gfo/Idh/MocA family oxidoreductase [Gammaproteobacteria bacterium]|nr:Gfo/Idh/MocA family oxidoreductase [Gammaproteobacteria bacterium]